ncbi:MAG: glycosyltransferase family 2 protein [Chlamydiota bacterium]
MSALLSICIPSYNRAHCLPDLLHSIISQYDERIEIVICDNGSSDETEEVVRSWQKLYPHIIYERFAKNVGPDRCFLRSVELGSGTFCWLMGDDDIIEPEGLKKVLESLDDSLTGITVNRAAYDLSLQRRWMEPAQGRDQDRLFQDAASCFSSLFVLFGFLSAQIIRRSLWLSIVEEEDVSLYFNAYVLIYIIGRMIQKNPNWLYIHTPCVGWRSDNDSFAKQLGSHGRFTLDILGYKVIAKGLFNNQKRLHIKIMNKVCSLHFLGHVRKIKLSSQRDLPIRKTFFLCLKHLTKIPSFWYKLLPVLLAPRRMLLILRPLYRYCKKKAMVTSD